MEDIKRSPGRPKGSGKNDGPTLAKVADLLAKNPKLRATTAMKQVIETRSDWGATPDTLLRRLQDKWKKDKVTLMEAARERASRLNVPRRSVGVGENLSLMSKIEAMQKFADSPMMKATLGYMQSPAYQKLVGWMSTPGYLAQMSAIETLARGLVEDPFQKRLVELQKAADTFSGTGLNKLLGSFF